MQKIGEHLLVIVVEVDVDLIEFEKICIWREKIRTF